MAVKECNCAFCTQSHHPMYDRYIEVADYWEPSPLTCVGGMGNCPQNNTCRYCDYWRYHPQYAEEMTQEELERYYNSCSKCGGEKDSEGWCANYCTNDGEVST